VFSISHNSIVLSSHCYRATLLQSLVYAIVILSAYLSSISQLHSRFKLIFSRYMSLSFLPLWFTSHVHDTAAVLSQLRTATRFTLPIPRMPNISLHFALVVDDAKSIVVMAVCACLCLSLAAFPHYCTDPDLTWRNGRCCPLVVHYWANLQSMHGFRCYDNIGRTRNVSECSVLALCLVLSLLIFKNYYQLKPITTNRLNPFSPFFFFFWILE